jgi:hypothetical protein
VGSRCFTPRTGPGTPCKSKAQRFEQVVAEVRPELQEQRRHEGNGPRWFEVVGPNGKAKSAACVRRWSPGRTVRPPHASAYGLSRATAHCREHGNDGSEPRPSQPRQGSSLIRRRQGTASCHRGRTHVARRAGEALRDLEEMDTAAAHRSAAQVGRDHRGTSRRAFRVRPNEHRQVTSLVELPVDGNRRRMAFDLHRLVLDLLQLGLPQKNRRGSRREIDRRVDLIVPARPPETGRVPSTLQPAPGVQVDTPQHEHSLAYLDKTQKVPHRAHEQPFSTEPEGARDIIGVIAAFVSDNSKMPTRVKRTEMTQGLCRSRCRRASGSRSG